MAPQTATNSSDLPENSEAQVLLASSFVGPLAQFAKSSKAYTFLDLKLYLLIRALGYNLA